MSESPSTIPNLRTATVVTTGMKQRTSTRQVKVSKAFQVIDEATRLSNQELRLLALEQDNYNEKEVLGLGNGDDDAYAESDVRA